jgi:uncharacterized membrane protein
MDEDQNKINQLLNKLEVLFKKQDIFQKEIDELRSEIINLQTSQKVETPKEKIKFEESVIKSVSEVKKEKTTDLLLLPEEVTESKLQKPSTSISPQRSRTMSNLEKFIGENLINKIGIVITVIGISIGVKYAIDHRLISPLTRIILGYIFGIGLLGFAIMLKKQYANFSAVLLSGAMAIMYFITYSAYDFYDLIPRTMAFILMVFFTAFTVISAIHYNKQVIAHIGLVGAYAVPFLLSKGSGEVAILFSYMTIINIGILVIAIKRYWKPLYYFSFGLTWLIYLTWHADKYRTDEYFGLALTFITIFFMIFYLTFLLYKLIKDEKFKIDDIIVLLANSFIFYGFGYSILSDHVVGEELLGLFTLINAIIHFIVSIFVYRNIKADKNLLYFVAGLVLLFITIAIPVQLNGNWVTLLWAGEAVMLFWIGRTKNVPVYEKFSYTLMSLSFLSIIHDWINVYNSYNMVYTENRITPLFNIHFLTSILFISAFFFITILNKKEKYLTNLNKEDLIFKTAQFLIPTILLSILYFTFRLEIANYWDQLFIDSKIEIKNNVENLYYNYQYDQDLEHFKDVWIINYSILFFTILSFFNIKRTKNKTLGLINLGLNGMFLLIFLTKGLYGLSELRDSYLNQNLAEYYQRSVFNVWIRYISLPFVGLFIFSCYKYIRQEFLKRNLTIAFDIVLFTSLLWIASSELINWMSISGYFQSYKLGLSILWGIYSLLLIVLGIWKKKKCLRIGAICLFGITLIKLFFYDISHLNTIPKTILFVLLGILLLIISFLYNKYKNLIFNENEN